MELDTRVTNLTTTIFKSNKVMKVKQESFWKFIAACLRTGNKELAKSNQARAELFGERAG